MSNINFELVEENCFLEVNNHSKPFNVYYSKSLNKFLAESGDTSIFFKTTKEVEQLTESESKRIRIYRNKMDEYNIEPIDIFMCGLYKSC